MVVLKFSCILIGENYSPASAEKLIGMKFQEKNENGDIAKNGRFRGQPLPYGSCIIRGSENNEIVFEILENHIDRLKNMGVEEIFLRLDVAFKAQCNFELDSKLLSRIAKLSLPLSISCFEQT